MEKVLSFIKSNVMLWILIALVLIFGLISNDFLTINNLLKICHQKAPLITASLGVGVIMISGGTDLSVGNGMAVVAVVSAMMMEVFHLPLILALAIGLVIGIAIGTVNGTASNLLKIHPMIVTLATMTIFSGVAKVLSGSTTFFKLDENLLNFGSGKIGPVYYDVIVVVVLAVVMHLILEVTCFGRFIYAAGGNQEAARLAGINVKKIKLFVFMIAGALYAVASIFIIAKVGSANSTTGTSTTFDAITACVLGGVSFIGGEGKVKGIVIGCLILAVLETGMQFASLDANAQDIVKGLILILSIGYETFSKGRKSKKAVA